MQLSIQIRIKCNLFHSRFARTLSTDTRPTPRNTSCPVLPLPRPLSLSMSPSTWLPRPTTAMTTPPSTITTPTSPPLPVTNPLQHFPTTTSRGQAGSHPSEGLVPEAMVWLRFQRRAILTEVTEAKKTTPSLPEPHSFNVSNNTGNRLYSFLRLTRNQADKTKE